MHNENVFVNLRSLFRLLFNFFQGLKGEPGETALFYDQASKGAVGNRGDNGLPGKYNLKYFQVKTIMGLVKIYYCIVIQYGRKDFGILYNLANISCSDSSFFTARVASYLSAAL